MAVHTGIVIVLINKEKVKNNVIKRWNILKLYKIILTYYCIIQPTNIQTFKYVYLLIQTRKLANNIKVMG